MFNDRELLELMGSYVFQYQTLWDFVKRPTYWTLAFFAVLLFIADFLGTDPTVSQTGECVPETSTFVIQVY